MISKRDKIKNQKSKLQKGRKKEEMSFQETSSQSNYVPTNEELDILIEGVKEYFQCTKRSEDRKHVVERTHSRLHELHIRDWNTVQIRLWFNNNKTKYVNTDE